MSLSELYGETPSPAAQSIAIEMRARSIPNLGILGNDSHTYGYHLSAKRLRATGHGGDASLMGPLNTPVGHTQWACAIDLGMAWTGSRAWLESVRVKCAAGTVALAEIIGSTDGRIARYAAPSTGWRWVSYHGDGHVSHSHLSIGRRTDLAGDAGLGAALFGDDMALTAAELGLLKSTHDRVGDIYLRRLNAIEAAVAAEKTRDVALLAIVDKVLQIAQGTASRDETQALSAVLVQVVAAQGELTRREILAALNAASDESPDPDEQPVHTSPAV